MEFTEFMTGLYQLLKMGFDFLVHASKLVLVESDKIIYSDGKPPLILETLFTIFKYLAVLSLWLPLVFPFMSIVRLIEIIYEVTKITFRTTYAWIEVIFLLPTVPAAILIHIGTLFGIFPALNDMNDINEGAPLYKPAICYKIAQYVYLIAYIISAIFLAYFIAKLFL